MVSLLILVNGNILRCILYTSKVIKGNTFCTLSGLLGVACSPILSVSFEGMGCEPALNLSATPDEAVSIICTVIYKTILLTLWRKMMYVSYTADWPLFQ
jgi:hypothetical protein